MSFRIFDEGVLRRIYGTGANIANIRLVTAHEMHDPPLRVPDPASRMYLQVQRPDGNWSTICHIDRTGLTVHHGNSGLPFRLSPTGRITVRGLR
jgi:hypothetical protein